MDGPHYERGNVLYDQRRWAMAEKEFRAELAESPRNSRAHSMLALCQQQLGRLAEAEQSAKEAIGLSPHSAHHHYVHSVVLGDQKKYREAEKAIDEAKRLSPRSATYHSHDAKLALDQGLYHESLDKAGLALSLDPNSAWAARLRALSHMYLNQLDEAAETMTMALSIHPDDAYCHAVLAKIQFKQKKILAAIQGYRESLRIDPTLEWARNGMMEALKSRNPLYGPLLALCWFGSARRVMWFGHPYALAVGMLLVVVGTFMKIIGPHLMRMMMALDPIAKDALDPDEIKFSKFLFGWLVASYVLTFPLLLFGWNRPIFLPIYSMLLWMPFVFTRVFELRDHPEQMRRARFYVIGTACVGAVAVLSAIVAVDPGKIQNAPINGYDVSASATGVFLFLSLFVRCFCPGPLATPSKT